MRDVRLWETRLLDGLCEKHAYERRAYEMAAYERHAYEMAQKGETCVTCCKFRQVGLQRHKETCSYRAHNDGTFHQAGLKLRG